MKINRWLLFSILTCLVIAIGSYFYATGMIDSLYAYRSPLHAKPPTPSGPLGEPLTRKVVIVLIDALRDDTSHKTDVMPFLNQLRSQSAWANMHSRPPSYSDPSWTTLLTGAWPEINDGPAMNLDYEDTPSWTQDNLFSAAHRAGLKTAISGYYWFEKLIPQDAGATGFYTTGEDAAADREVMDTALPWLSEDYQFILIHLDQVDYAGHYEGGPPDARWDTAAKRTDALLREITEQLDLTQDTLVVLSDHGQIDRGGHGGQDPIVLLEPFVLTGADIKPGRYPDIQQVDVAPTIAIILGINIPAANQGHVLMDMLNLPPERISAVTNALEIQQKRLFTAYTTAIGQTTSLGESLDVVSATQTAMDKARLARLSSERVWRNLVAFFIAILPAYILIVRRDWKALWYVGGALLYALFFNLRYAVLDGRTYSLSSAASQTDIIMFVAITSVFSYSIVWLIIMLVTSAFRTRPRNAAKKALSLTLYTIYILSLPILWSFVRNGVLITWTLPDFLSMYIAFLSVMQCLFVAAIGLFLSGVSTLIAQFVRH